MKITINSENYFDIAEVIHCYASLNHSGQWSDLYSVLSESEFNPGPSWSETRVLRENEFYNELTEKTCLELHEQLKTFMRENV